MGWRKGGTIRGHGNSEGALAGDKLGHNQVIRVNGITDNGIKQDLGRVHQVRCVNELDGSVGVHQDPL